MEVNFGQILPREINQLLGGESVIVVNPPGEYNKTQYTVQVELTWDQSSRTLWERRQVSRGEDSVCFLIYYYSYGGESVYEVNLEDLRPIVGEFYRSLKNYGLDKFDPTVLEVFLQLNNY